MALEIPNFDPRIAASAFVRLTKRPSPLEGSTVSFHVRASILYAICSKGAVVIHGKTPYPTILVVVPYYILCCSMALPL